MKNRIISTKWGYVINDKYLIDKKGIIWYWDEYIGKRTGNFPKYIFNLRDKIIKGV